MSRQSEYFFRQAGGVARIYKWKIIIRVLFWSTLVGLSALEALIYIARS